MYSFINRVIAAKSCYTLGWKLNVNNPSIKRLFSRSSVLKSPAEINTNVAKDVILFKYENPRFYRIMNICGITQYMFWQYVGYVGYTTIDNMRLSKRIPEDAPWYTKLFTEKYSTAVFTTAIIIGTGTLILTWMYTLRSIRYLVLNKGGNTATLVTYTPFGNNRMMTVPLKDMSCEVSRNTTKSQLPLKIKRRLFYYLMDMRGEFKSPNLFDHTAGLKRTLTK